MHGLYDILDQWYKYYVQRWSYNHGRGNTSQSLLIPPPGSAPLSKTYFRLQAPYFIHGRVTVLENQNTLCIHTTLIHSWSIDEAPHSPYANNP